MGRRRRLVAAAIAVSAVAACAGPARRHADTPSGTPQVHPAWTSCAAELAGRSAAAVKPTAGVRKPSAGVPEPARPYLPFGGSQAGALPRLGDDFAPSAVIVCGETVERRADGGQDLVATESRADDVAGLVAALRLPDEPPSDDPCPANLVLVPFFVLLDAEGRWVRPGVPADACSQPRREVRDAISALSLTRVAGRPPGEAESGRPTALRWSTRAIPGSARCSAGRAAAARRSQRT